MFDPASHACGTGGSYGAGGGPGGDGPTLPSIDKHIDVFDARRMGGVSAVSYLQRGDTRAHKAWVDVCMSGLEAETDENEEWTKKR